jgi:hypothetical protein
VHGAELVVELGQHDAARRVRRAEQASNDRDRLHRERELPAHQRHQGESEEQEQQRRHRVLNPDNLMVLGENVLPHEALFVIVRMNMGVGARGRVSGCRHVIQRRDSFLKG